MIPECPVCLRVFGSDVTPMVMRCGHGICEGCAKKLPVMVHNKAVFAKCPECRGPGWNIDEPMTINYPLLALIARVRANAIVVKEESKPVASQPPKLESPDVEILPNPPKRRKLFGCIYSANGKVHARGARISISGHIPVEVDIGGGATVSMANSVFADGNLSISGVLDTSGQSMPEGADFFGCVIANGDVDCSNIRITNQGTSLS